MRNQLRLGLIVDPEFYMLERSVCALTPMLIRAFCRTFATRIIYDQSTYDRCCTEVDFIVSLEPKWAAPVLEWRRAGIFRKTLPHCPCYVVMSDPHIESWRVDYFSDQRLDYILALYYHPTIRHFRTVPREKIFHFPWSIPDEWIDDSGVEYRGTDSIAVFGAAKGEAYELRNWCREQPGVQSFSNSGVENKLMEDRDFFEWLKGFDAVIAAGSENSKYRLTTPKYFETAAVGSLLFAQETDDLDRLGFVDGENCIIFSKATFREKADKYLSDPSDNRWIAIRTAGRELIRARHTIQRRLAELEAHVRGWEGR